MEIQAVYVCGGDDAAGDVELSAAGAVWDFAAAGVLYG